MAWTTWLARITPRLVEMWYGKSDGAPDTSISSTAVSVSIESDLGKSVNSCFQIEVTSRYGQSAPALYEMAPLTWSLTANFCDIQLCERASERQVI